MWYHSPGENPKLKGSRKSCREAGGRGLGREEAAERASPSEEPSEDSEESSSGSDTFVPADCDHESSSDDGRAFHGRRYGHPLVFCGSTGPF